MPTGGINAKNLEDYLSCDKILCCGGSWMVKGDLVKAGEFDKIRELTAEAKNQDEISHSYEVNPLEDDEVDRAEVEVW